MTNIKGGKRLSDNQEIRGQDNRISGYPENIDFKIDSFPDDLIFLYLVS